MNAKIIGAAFLFILFHISALGQNWDIEWEKKMGTQNLDVFTDVIQNNESGFTVIGTTFPEGKQDMDFWLIKFSAAGDLVWSKTMGTANNDFPSSLEQCNDGGYIISGKTQVGDNIFKAFLLKTDNNGSEIWQKILEKDGWENATNVIVTNDESFVVSGEELTSDGNKNIWLAKLTGEGEFVWEKSYGENKAASPASLKKLPDGGFAMAGQISEKGSKDSDLWIFRFDKNGEKMWDTQVKSPGINMLPECICCSPDSNIVAVGWYGTCMNDLNSADPIFDYDLFITQISSKGKFLWTKNIDSEGSEGGNAVVIRPDGKFLLAGKKETSYLGRIGPWLLLTDKKGTVLSELVLPFIFNGDQAAKIINTSDGGFVVIGPGDIDPDKTRSDGWIKKFKAF
ncbi:MAG TPA: hypothetical protein VKA38_11335 [Draconibacterium sp.]|nr:hypothetical protein [Draconibacterium sp.]